MLGSNRLPTTHPPSYDGANDDKRQVRGILGTGSTLVNVAYASVGTAMFTLSMNWSWRVLPGPPVFQQMDAPDLIPLA